MKIAERLSQHTAHTNNFSTLYRWQSLL